MDEREVVTVAVDSAARDWCGILFLPTHSVFRLAKVISSLTSDFYLSIAPYSHGTIVEPRSSFHLSRVNLFAPNPDCRRFDSRESLRDVAVGCE